MKSTASLKNPLVIMIAQANAIPKTERNAFTGLLSMFLNIILVGWERNRPSPIFSTIVFLNLAGGSGHIAFAGGTFEAFHTECTVPSSAEPIVTSEAIPTTEGLRSYM